MYKIKRMTEWASVITPRRSKYLPVLDKIERVGVNTSRRQVGNVISDLRNMGEFDLIHELKEEIEAYNAGVVDMHNREVDFVVSVRAMLKRFKRNEAYWDAWHEAFPGGVVNAAEMYAFDPYRALNEFQYILSRR